MLCNACPLHIEFAYIIDQLLQREMRKAIKMKPVFYPTAGRQSYLQLLLINAMILYAACAKRMKKGKPLSSMLWAQIVSRLQKGLLSPAKTPAVSKNPANALYLLPLSIHKKQACCLLLLDNNNGQNLPSCCLYSKKGSPWTIASLPLCDCFLFLQATEIDFAFLICFSFICAGSQRRCFL